MKPMKTQRLLRALFWFLTAMALGCACAALWAAFWSPWDVYKGQTITAALAAAGTLLAGVAILVDYEVGEHG